MRRQRGFTLIEMMVVVTIIGILATMAFAYMRPRVTTLDVSNRIGQLVRESSRRAVSLGPVRADVAANLLSKARTRIIATGGTNPTFTLQYLVENALPSNGGSWVSALSYTTYRDVTADSWAVGVGAKAALTPTTDFSTLNLKCYPDGTCDAVSIFLFSTDAKKREQKARMSVMPLGAAIYTRTDWF